MAKKGAQHLLLTEQTGGCSGWSGQADLLGTARRRCRGPDRAIGNARDLDAMAIAADRVRRRGAELFHSGMGVEALCQWMSGPQRPDRHAGHRDHRGRVRPAGGALVLARVFGSEGRLEQTFATDQDNGLIFVPPERGATDAVRAAFLPVRRKPSTRPCTTADSSAAAATSWPATRNGA